MTTILLARHGETDLIVGNLLGSNLFNALVVGGAVGVIGSPAIDAPNLTIVAVAASIVVAAMALGTMMTGRRVSRKEDVVLALAYAAFIPFLA